MFPGIGGLVDNALSLGRLTDKDHYLKYIIDTDLPSLAPTCEGDSDLWVNMQNLYYAEVKITRQYKITGDLKQWHFDEFDMIIHCDTKLPFDRIAVTFQQVITEIVGPANRLFGEIKIYRKTVKYKHKADWWLVKDTPMMNIHQQF